MEGGTLAIALATHKETGLPFIEDIEISTELPHSVTFAIMYNSKINSFYELPKDKRPPRGIYDKPNRLDEFLDEVWEPGYKKESEENLSIEFDPEEVE